MGRRFRAEKEFPRAIDELSHPVLVEGVKHVTCFRRVSRVHTAIEGVTLEGQDWCAGPLGGDGMKNLRRYTIALLSALFAVTALDRLVAFLDLGYTAPRGRPNERRHVERPESTTVAGGHHDE